MSSTSDRPAQESLLLGRWQRDLSTLAQHQLFFVGGIPRSGTTWLQQMLDAHPNVSCKGEGLFMNRVAAPIDTIIAEWRKAVEAKNRAFFDHTGGYKVPASEDADILTGTAILLALQRQNAEKGAWAVGEKTPENAFFFRRFYSIFPDAKFIGIARDPRDMLTSAWHFFHQPRPGENEAPAQLAFVRKALPSLGQGALEMLNFAKANPANTAIITYEGLSHNQGPILAHLFRLIGVSDDADIVVDCMKRSAFVAVTGGRPAGTELRGSFLRKGIVGDWRSTLTADAQDLIVHELGWMFETFEWRI